jgi:hypothetical protein
MLVALLAAGALSSVSAQVRTPIPNAPPSQTAVRDTEQAIIVEGCIYGDRLKLDVRAPGSRVVAELLDVRELRLEGQKELLKILRKEHDGHQDEVSGVVIIPAGYDATVKTTEVGKRTKVTAGTKSTGKDSVGTLQPDRIEKPNWLRMKVTAVRHIFDKCLTPG